MAIIIDNEVLIYNQSLVQSILNCIDDRWLRELKEIRFNKDPINGPVGELILSCTPKLEAPEIRPWSERNVVLWLAKDGISSIYRLDNYLQAFVRLVLSGLIEYRDSVYVLSEVGQSIIKTGLEIPLDYLLRFGEHMHCIDNLTGHRKDLVYYESVYVPILKNYIEYDDYGKCEYSSDNLSVLKIKANNNMIQLFRSLAERVRVLENHKWLIQYSQDPKKLTACLFHSKEQIRTIAANIIKRRGIRYEHKHK